MLQGRKLLLGVSGSIACYKAADMASALSQRGVELDVVMTRAATRFVTPLTFHSLTRRPVYSELFDPHVVTATRHVELAERCELVCLAPATANLIGKIASGIADDLLTTVVMAVKSPVLLAPAMNENMYRNPIVQRNVRTLQELGYEFVEPEQGTLACGTVGEGRLAAPETIIARIEAILGRVTPST